MMTKIVRLILICTLGVAVCPWQSVAVQPSPGNPIKGAACPSYMLLKPPYPLQARAANAQGAGVVRVIFNAKGQAVKAIMIKSTGWKVLDSNTIAFALARWKIPDGQEKSIEVPVAYQLR